MSQIFMVPGTYDENLAHVEPGDVASRNYAAGEFLTWKGVLHSAKTAISTGETFVEDTNVQDESDGGLAKALSSKMLFNGFSKIVDLKSYTSSSSPYYTENNGYLMIIHNSSGADTFAKTFDGEGNVFTICRVRAIDGGMETIYLPKGMPIWFDFAADRTNSLVKFACLN